MDDETYVRRRRWSVEEKCAVVTEALSSGNVIATAKRHGIQAQQIYRWRERLDERQSLPAFLPVSIAPDSVPLNPTPVLDQGSVPRSSVSSIAMRSSGSTASFWRGGAACVLRMPARTVAIWRSLRSSGRPR